MRMAIRCTCPYICRIRETHACQRGCIQPTQAAHHLCQVRVGTARQGLAGAEWLLALVVGVEVALALEAAPEVMVEATEGVEEDVADADEKFRCELALVYNP